MEPYKVILYGKKGNDQKIVMDHLGFVWELWRLEIIVFPAMNERPSKMVNSKHLILY